MWPISTKFAQALRTPHSMVVRVDAYVGATLIAGDIGITAGVVNVNSGSGVRRTLDLTIANRGLWSTLDQAGVELWVRRGIRFPDGTTETVPVGVFRLNSMSMSMTPGGIEVRSAPDRWDVIQKDQFEVPEPSIRGNTVVYECWRLVIDAINYFYYAYFWVSDQKTVVSQLVWDRDRATAINDLATSIAGEVFFDGQGDLVIQDMPKLSQEPVWTVDAGVAGVMLGGTRTRDRSRTYNVVVATMSAVDGRTPFAPQVAADTNASSRTYVSGPMGRVPYFYSSPNFRTAAQALASAKALLLQLKAPNAQITLEQVVNPALDRGDVITVLMPDGATELHMIDSLTIPLDVGTPQQITTKSGWPDGVVPAGE